MIVYYLMMLTMALFYLLLNRVIITYKGNCINVHVVDSQDRIGNRHVNVFEPELVA